ncbi:hypothetical protein RchiOBHm_Chr7g0199791 [Rosa chinensis]|uniref:Uncharacterized protein n=1 Tax=Rosa chinensis TaxID=74649 RepID=A0A2P6P7H1_ROSCH|nr:hypothetical protein RchiOBHm_Chr7g0199791 [Rosa chinensis]
MDSRQSGYLLELRYAFKLLRLYFFPNNLLTLTKFLYLVLSKFSEMLRELSSYEG